MSRVITSYADVPKVYWVAQRQGRDYVYVEHTRPEALLELPRQIYLDKEGRSKAAIRIAGRPPQADSPAPASAPVADGSAPDPIAEKRSRLMHLRGKPLHYVDDAAVRALLGIGEADASAVASPRSAEAASMQQAFDAIHFMLERDSIVLDLEFCAPLSQELCDFQSAVKLLQSLGVDLAEAQLNRARRQVGDVSARQVVAKMRAAVGRHALITAPFQVAGPGPENGNPEHYRIAHRHCDSEHLGRDITLTARLDRERIRDAAKQLYHIRLNRSMALSLFGTVQEANERDGALDVVVRPIAVFSGA
jgi:hypothetical protein